ncbi:hypothetical protein [Sagittula salina]|uniref:Lipoprotein n=1 Tax=Sagittula salina TaxID=2820268 RepID=A0A940MR50_9RHOB|nr:hypothetical protein [Sagittula salina]MBP0483864.1 hypothetical protein [Sagittula salina]
MRKIFFRIGLALTLAATLSGCSGDPLRDVPRLAEVDVAEAAGEAEVVASDGGEVLPETAASGEAPRRGLLGFLKRKADAGKAEAVAPGSVGEVAAKPDGEFAEPADVETGETAAQGAAPQAKAVAVAAPAQDRGLFGFLKGTGADGGGTLTAMPADSSRASRYAPKPGAVDAREVPFGRTLPYGEIARVCNVPETQLGTKAGSWPERGARYDLRDSAPGSTGARTYYLTGFRDGCARQFTAALVMFGSPETWEQIHYGPAGESLPVLATDTAFEAVKSRVCRVGAGKPCGKRMSALERDTVFVSLYERFEDNTRWKNLLIHGGEVVAMGSSD